MTSRGRFERWRRAAFAAQAAVVVGLPFARAGGESALRFDVPTLTLHAAGARLQIDELFVVLAAVLSLGFLFALGTLLLGRVWCGWGCPQTALGELTRPLALLPSASERRGRRPGPARLVANGLALAAVSALVAANLLWYFVEPGDFARRLAAGTLGPVLGGSWAALAALLFLDLGFLRWRWCAAACPYAKLQGALYDRSTLTVAFDAARAGDCVECGACVRICPTDIDIRRGLQSECIACAACSDACAPIMARLGKRNLVAYAWGEPGGARRLLRGASVTLAALTAASLGLAAAAVAGREPLDLVAGAAAGSVARRTPDGRALNAFDLSLTNRGRAAMDVALALDVGGAAATLRPDALRLGPGEHRRVRVLAAVRLPAGSAPVPSTLVAEAPGAGARMTRPLTFVPPDPEQR